MIQKILGTAMLAAGLGVVGLSGTAQAASLSVDGAYINADGSVGAGQAKSTLNGVQYTVSFRTFVGNHTLCVPTVTTNVGQFAVGSARVINGRPVTVNVILMDGSGNGITGPDFYLTVNCAK